MTLLRLVGIQSGVGVLHVVAQLGERLVRLAGLRVGVAGVVGAVEHQRVGGRKVPPVVASSGVEQRGGAGVLPGVEQRRAERAAQLRA